MFTTSMVQMKYSVSIRVILHFAVQSNQEIYNNFKVPVDYYLWRVAENVGYTIAIP